MPDRFQRLSTRQRGEAEDPTLVDGVPSWMRSSMAHWLGLVVGTERPSPATLEILRTIEREFRHPLVWSAGGRSVTNRFIQQCLDDGSLCLDVVDFLLQRGHASVRAPALELILSQAGSAWRVHAGDNGFVLIRRLDETIVAAVEATIERGRPGEMLGKAWRAAFGRDPDASTAYREAVRSVEAAARPVIEPSNAVATLGTMIRVLGDARHRFTVQLSSTRVDPIDGTIAMMKLLWHSQVDRHGTSDESIPLTVSLEEARTAFFLAATLVEWFTSGSVARTE